MTDPDWFRSANCATTDPEVFFPEKKAGQNSSFAAKKVCRRCPVIAECLQYALSAPWTEYGVWGGTTEHERRHIRRIDTTRRTA